MAGLLDAYTLTGNAAALDIAAGWATGSHSRLGRLPAAQLDRMWSHLHRRRVRRHERGHGRPLRAHRRRRYLATARCFDNTALLDACAAGTRHPRRQARQPAHPAVPRLPRGFRADGRADYLDAAPNFWDMVVPHRTYAHGGTGQGEMFRPAGAPSRPTSATRNAETCATYNMLKLTRPLLPRRGPHVHGLLRDGADQPDPRLPRGTQTTSPEVTYLLPVGPGVRARVRQHRHLLRRHRAWRTTPSTRTRSTSARRRHAPRCTSTSTSPRPWTGPSGAWSCSRPSTRGRRPR